MGADVTFYRKFWDEEQKKYVIGTDEGQLMTYLKSSRIRCRWEEPTSC